MTATAAELVALDASDEANVDRILAGIDRIETLGLKLAADRDELQARLSAAAMFLRHAIAAATSALDAYDHRQPSIVHDGVVEALAHLRTLAAVLTGTPPEQEAPPRNRSRH